MNEKDTALLSDDYGRDLASVQALQRKHEGLERDLAALEDKVKVLKGDSAQVTVAQPNSAKIIRGKEKEVMDAWKTLKSRVCHKWISINVFITTYLLLHQVNAHAYTRWAY